MPGLRFFHLVCLAPGLLLAGLAQPAQTAALTGDTGACSPADFPAQHTIRSATVNTSAPRLYFFDGHDGCPDDGPRCQSKAYVTAGDPLLVGRVHGAWICALYLARNPAKAHDTAGWVHSADVTVQAPQPAASNDWMGLWTARGLSNYVGVREAMDGWRITGGATWSDGARMEHSTLSGVLGLSGAHAYLDGKRGPDGQACSADLTLVGGVLVVHDNGECGSAKARFDGVYMPQR